MKINLVLPTPDLSGGWRVFAIHAQNLVNSGHEVTCAWSARPPMTLRQKLRSVKNGKGWPTQKQEATHFDGLQIPFVEVSPARPVRDCDLPDADVVLATWWETAKWVSTLAPSKGAKAYFIQHDEQCFEGVPKDRALATWQMPMHKITISKWLVDLAAARGDHDVTLVPNSVDMQQFNAPPRERQAQPTIGLLYSTTRFKGVDVSLEAIRLAASAIPNLKVITFGAEHVAGQLPLPPGAEANYRPNQKAIKDIYARCDVWLCGSHSEGFHLPPLEAMACRCPVISTRVGGSMDVIEEGVNGHLVNTGDSVALAERLVRVLTLSNSSWKSMSDAALATAQRYSWEDATARMEQGLRAAVDKRQRSPWRGAKGVEGLKVHA